MKRLICLAITACSLVGMVAQCNFTVSKYENTYTFVTAENLKEDHYQFAGAKVGAQALQTLISNNFKSALRAEVSAGVAKVETTTLDGGQNLAVEITVQSNSFLPAFDPDYPKEVNCPNRADIEIRVIIPNNDSRTFRIYCDYGSESYNYCTQLEISTQKILKQCMNGTRQKDEYRAVFLATENKINNLINTCIRPSDATADIRLDPQKVNEQAKAAEKEAKQQDKEAKKAAKRQAKEAKEAAKKQAEAAREKAKRQAKDAKKKGADAKK